MIFKNHFGFSLVESMIAIGISTGASLIIFKSMDASKQSQKNVENKSEIHDLHNQITSRLSDRFTCTNTLMNIIMSEMNGGLLIDRILDAQNNILFTIPMRQGSISLDELKVVNIDRIKKQADIDATYSYLSKAKTTKIHRRMQLELTFQNNNFAGCVSSGTLSIDPKDACDLVIGYDANGQSYFYDSRCHFPQASCEQSGRVWNKESLKCNFSDNDLEALRKEICETLGFLYSEETNKCVPKQEHLDMAQQLNDLKKSKEQGP